jgi:hypothetical protein
MRVLRRAFCLALLLNVILSSSTLAQKPLTWQEVRAKFEALNPTLRAVDSAYATTVEGNLVLLKPYKERYLQMASRVRDTIAFSYQQGAAPFLDFLNAQADYRSVETNDLNLVASRLDAANLLNEAVGQEVIP